MTRPPSIPIRARPIIGAVSQLFGNSSPLVGAEIGVLQGAVAGALLWSFPNLTLYLVDPYQHKPRPDYEATGDYVAFLSDQEHQVNRLIAVENMAFASDARKIWVPMFSPEAADAVPMLDFCFIDADHSPAGITADLAAWFPKIKRPGIFAGHDWNFDPVCHAVTKFAADNALTIEVGDHATWYVRLE